MASKKELFLDFRLHISACSRCPFGKVRDNPITGDGEYRSPILVIGPSPRKRDDEEGCVFSGRAGQKLEKMFNKAELDLSKTFRTYAIRCYGGRDPSYGEFAAFKRCQAHTTSLIKLMRPSAVVICGFKAFKWILLRWTSEVVDDRSFFKWIGQTVRLKEVWGDIKFFVIANPATLAKKRDPEAESKSIDTIAEMKRYVVSHQKGEPVALEMTDLSRRPHTRSQQQTFGWL
jgi:uracil-DNA glycosylase family 4